MIICTRCGKENQDQHKFCLRCGAELGPTAAPPPAAAPPMATPAAPPADHAREAMAKTMMADPGQLPASMPGQPAGAPFGGAPFIAPTPFSPPASALPLPGMPPAAPGLPPQKPKSSPGGLPSPFSVTPPTPGGVPGPPPPLPFGMSSAAAMPAAAPSPFAPPAAASGSPFGAPPPAPSPFGAPPPAAPNAAPPVAPAAAATVPSTCPSCGSMVPPGFKFCGVCGYKLEPAAAAMPAPAPEPEPAPPEPAPAPRIQGRMTLIRPDGSEGGTYDIVEGTNRLGRTTAPVFENDGYLSPDHAELTLTASGAIVKDSQSLNGVFVKMNGEEEIQPGDIFRIGQELMRFDTIAPPTPLEDGTEIMGSPNPGYWGRISVIIGKDIDGSAFPLLGDAVTLGRERGDINFPDDGYVSGLHARLSTRNGRYYLSDLGSSNGTFVKLSAERALENGSFVLLGQQLFRVNY